MKKFLSCFFGFVLAATTLGVAGCKKENDKSITYYLWGSREEIAMAQQLADDFELLHPEWKVEVQPSNGIYYDNLKTYFGGGNAPDLFYMEGGMIEGFIKDGLLLELDEYLEKGENLDKSDLWELNDSYRYDSANGKMGSGKLYAVIKDLTPDFMMIYNKKHIEKYNEENAVSLAEAVGYPTDESGVYPSADVPMSWAQCTKMCRLLTKFDSNGDITRYGTTLDQVPWKHVMEWIQMGGDTLFTEDMHYLNVGSDAVKSAFEYFISFQSGDTKSAASVTNSEGGGEGFKNGEISVVWNGRWAFESYGWYDVNFEIGVAPPPTPNGGGEAYCATTMISHAISAQSKNPDIAYAFLEYYMTAGMKEYVRTGYNIPGNKTIAYGDFLNVDDAYHKQLNNYFIKYLEKASPLTYNFYIDQSRVESILGDYIPRVWAEQNPMTLTQALNAAASEINAAISRGMK
ncbi:MAG: extracellular solute-binding protein [Clostridia bacterium]|nr:extracellular solute-binding protein [Clostridia bacterium]